MTDWINPLAAGPGAALDTLQIALVDMRSDMLHRVLHGGPKVVISEWNGDHRKPDDFHPVRGDGRATLLIESDPEFLLPPNVWHSKVNWWQAAAFWLVNRQQQNQAIAAGLLYPLFASCAYDVWTPDGGYVSRYYSTDPRIDAASAPWPERPLGIASFEAEEKWCYAYAGNLNAKLRRAPRLEHMPEPEAD